MIDAPCLQELRDNWFPHTTDAGLDRLISLLESGSPLLIHGAFTRALPMGCLATHIAWNHPETADYQLDAGIAWLTHVAGLNPATSHVIRAWDCGGQTDWELRQALLTACREERDSRQESIEPDDCEAESELVPA
ncbi:MAG TPA: hypothetical protein VHR66_04905 [Gemmataceae bacterium]|jgi:hypothetical protein|nr:hypothetical protein [Gemmataceae bacterium]